MYVSESVIQNGYSYLRTMGGSCTLTQLRKGRLWSELIWPDWQQERINDTEEKRLVIQAWIKVLLGDPFFNTSQFVNQTFSMPQGFRLVLLDSSLVRGRGLHNIIASWPVHLQWVLVLGGYRQVIKWLATQERRGVGRPWVRKKGERSLNMLTRRGKTMVCVCVGGRGKEFI